MQNDERQAVVTGWFHQYGDRVLAYLMHRCDPQVAPDLLQDVFVLAYKKAGVIEEPVISWLFGTARRVAANHRRGRRRLQALIDRAGSDLQANRQPAGSAADQPVGAALAALPAADREVLELAYWYDLTPAEAAAVLGCRPATYSVRLHRARSRLREQLPAMKESLVRELDGELR